MTSLRTKAHHWEPGTGAPEWKVKIYSKRLGSLHNLIFTVLQSFRQCFVNLSNSNLKFIRLQYIINLFAFAIWMEKKKPLTKLKEKFCNRQ